MSRIVVLGATGFIGRNVVERMATLFPNNVVGVHYKRDAVAIDGVEWKRVDLRDASQIQNLFQEDDIVIQMAATTSGAKDISTTPFIHVTDNAVMNSLILRACYEKNVKQFIFPSCGVVYPSNCHACVKEHDWKIEDNSTYFGVGWTKIYIEKMCQFYAGLGKTKHTVIRHANTYGPYDKYDLERSHMYGATITKVMQAENNSTMTMWGTGEEKRELLYIEDLVNFIVCALKQENMYELVNVGTGISSSVLDIIKTIVHISGKNLTIETDSTKPTMPSQAYLDSSKAKAIFGWEAKHSLEEGTKKTIEWYKKKY